MRVDPRVLQVVSRGGRASMIVYGCDPRVVIMALLNNEIGSKIDCVAGTVYVRLDGKELATLAESVPSTAVCILEH